VKERNFTSFVWSIKQSNKRVLRKKEEREKKKENGVGGQLQKKCWY